MMKKKGKKRENGTVIVNVEMSVFDKIKVLDDYYLWLFENDYDGSLAQVLARYKQLLFESEKKKKKDV